MHNADLKLKWQMLNEKEQNGFTSKKIMQFKEKLKDVSVPSSTANSDFKSNP